VVDDDQIKSLIESNPHYTTQEIAEIIDVSQKTVVNHLHTLGYVSRYDIWIPHNLSDKNLMDLYLRFIAKMRRKLSIF